MLPETETRRGVEFNVYYPAAGKGYPLLVFAHGNWSTKDSYDRVIEHWVSHGYAVIAPDGVPRQGANGRTWGFHPLSDRQMSEISFLEAVRDDALGRIIVVGDAPAHNPDWNRAFRLAAGFQRSGAIDEMRQVSAVYTGRKRRGAEFFARLAEQGGGDFIPHRGRMMESVLLSVLTDGAT